MSIERHHLLSMVAERNARLHRKDIRWIATDSGEMKLIDDPNWAARHQRWLLERDEAERQQHKHRLLHPLNPHEKED